MRRQFVVTLILSSVFSARAFAAACCSSQSAAPSVITGDERTRFSLASTASQVIADAPPEGLSVFRESKDFENSIAQTLSAATLVSDRFQVGSALTWLHRGAHAGDPSQSGVSQWTIGGAYEAVTDWTYHPIRPKVVTFVSYSVPFGSSIYDTGSNGSAASPAFGTGFQRLTVGAIALKQMHPWDFSWTVEAHRSISRTFSGGGAPEFTVIPGWGGSSLANGGHVWGPHRAGMRMGYELDQGRRIQSASNASVGKTQSRVSVGFDYAYTFENEMLVAAHYTDQTLLGPSRNVALSRMVGIEWSMPLQR